MAFGAEFEDLFNQNAAFGLFAHQRAVEVLAFAGEFCKFELQKITLLFDSKSTDVRSAVDEFGVAGLYLFQVADIVAEAAFADGEDVVGEVREHLGALEVVYGEAALKPAFRGVGEREDGEAVFVFELAERRDQAKGAAGALVGAVAEKGDVVDDDHFGLAPLDGFDEGFVEVFGEGIVIGGIVGVHRGRGAAKLHREWVEIDKFARIGT